MTVNNVNALLAYGTAKVDAAGNIADESSAGSFEQVMSKLNGKTDALQSELSGGNLAAAQKVVPVSSVQKDIPVGQADTVRGAQKDSAARKESGGNVTQDTRENAGADDKDAVSEKLGKSGEKLIKDIADEMDVTTEEVEEAMTVLGLTALQLFDTDNLKQLLLAISGNTDELSLLTDEMLYGTLQDLMGVVAESLEDLQQELGLSGEELDALMKQLISEQGESGMSAEELAEAMSEANLEGMKDYTVSVRKDGETVQMKVSVDDASGDRSVQESVVSTPKTEVSGGRKMQERDSSADNGKEGGAAGNSLLQMQETPTEVETPEPVNVEYRSMQTEEIMNQIMDYMKINLKADTQSMELQLHPASLGTLNVQIVAKDGALTAHFTTQSETVRAVIETQLIQLKNQFEEQGIKVNAVEVTVANHEYGQQFSQGNENAGQGQEKTGKSRRRINLNQIDGEEDLEEMDDSERIAVEMMQANGSTVDYTA